MYSLILAIVLNTLIFVIFRLLVPFKVNTFQTIVVNYIVCAAIGFYFIDDINDLVMLNYNLVWVQTAGILGVLFVFTFYVIGYTTQACGISVATVANKMSLIIPVFFSIYVFDEWKRIFSSIQYLGIIVAIIAIICTSLKGKKQTKVKIPPFYFVVLPILVFVFGGAIDTLINYSKFFIISIEQDKIFTTLVFLGASVVGVIVLIIQVAFTKEEFQFKCILSGILLGVPNFFSIYYIVQSLTVFNNNGAFVYPVCNMGIILLSSLFSLVVFKEKLTKINLIGIGLAMLALIMIAYKEISGFLK